VLKEVDEGEDHRHEGKLNGDLEEERQQSAQLAGEQEGQVDGRREDEVQGQDLHVERKQQRTDQLAAEGEAPRIGDIAAGHLDGISMLQQERFLLGLREKGSGGFYERSGGCGERSGGFRKRSDGFHKRVDGAFAGPFGGLFRPFCEFA
jgi:hypothetical protein